MLPSGREFQEAAPSMVGTVKTMERYLEGWTMVLFLAKGCTCKEGQEPEAGTEPEPWEISRTGADYRKTRNVGDLGFLWWEAFQLLTGTTKAMFIAGKDFGKQSRT